MHTITSKLAALLCLFVTLFFYQNQSFAQTNNRSITVHQYRYVPYEKVDEFIKRETTYWTKVAQKAMDKKMLSSWILLQKVGGSNLNNTANFVLINKYPDIDKAYAVWSNAAADAGTKMADMETSSISKIIDQVFLHEESWIQAKDADLSKDFNYVVMIQHNTNYSDSLINMEKKIWVPFVQQTMDNRKTSMTAWGNAVILSPKSEEFKFTTLSYDVYKTLQDALMPYWSPDVTPPMDDLRKITALELNRRNATVYRVVKAMTNE